MSYLPIVMLLSKMNTPIMLPALLSSFEQKMPITAAEAAARILETTSISRNEQQVSVFT